MPRYRDDDDETDDVLDEHELPDEADRDEHDDPVETPCPYCGAAVSELAEVCPRCGNYISSEDAPPARKPKWFLIGLALCLIVVLVFWIL